MLCGTLGVIPREILLKRTGLYLRKHHSRYGSFTENEINTIIHYSHPSSPCHRVLGKHIRKYHVQCADFHAI
jgi:hypothetical protein